MTRTAAVTLARATDFQEAIGVPKIPASLWVRRICFSALVGTILLLTNFPKFLTRTIDINVSDPAWRNALHVPVQVSQTALVALIGDRPIEFFERVMTWNFFLVWVFLALVSVFSIRRRGVRMLAYGLGGILLGYFALHLIAWAAVAVVVTVGGAVFVVRWVGAAITAIITLVMHYRVALLLLVASTCIYILRAHVLRALRGLARSMRQYAVQILGVSAAGVVLVVLVPVLYRWVIAVIAPVIAFFKWLLTPVFTWILFLAQWLFVAIFTVLLVGVVILAGILSLALVGSLFLSQLQAGWHAARSLRHVMITGFAIGSSLALIALVSVATPAVAHALNSGWTNALAFFGVGGSGVTTDIVTNSFLLFLPITVESFLFTYLTSLQAPALDSLILLTMMALASQSVLLRVLSMKPIEDEYVPIRFVAQEFVMMALGLFVALIWTFAAAETGDLSAE